MDCTNEGFSMKCSPNDLVKDTQIVYGIHKAPMPKIAYKKKNREMHQNGQDHKSGPKILSIAYLKAQFLISR